MILKMWSWLSTIVPSQDNSPGIFGNYIIKTYHQNYGRADNFALVNVRDDIGEELEELKRQLLGVSVSQLTPSDISENATSTSRIDDELEAMRKQVENL